MRICVPDNQLKEFVIPPYELRWDTKIKGGSPMTKTKVLNKDLSNLPKDYASIKDILSDSEEINITEEFISYRWDGNYYIFFSDETFKTIFSKNHTNCSICLNSSNGIRLIDYFLFNIQLEKKIQNILHNMCRVLEE